MAFLLGFYDLVPLFLEENVEDFCLFSGFWVGNFSLKEVGKGKRFELVFEIKGNKGFFC
jgi:hypothetical protein